MQTTALIERLRHQDEPRPVVETRRHLGDGIVERRRQRFGAPDDDQRRATEERRRHQIAERLVDARGIVVAPHHTDTRIPAWPGHARPQARQPALDQKRVVAVQERVRTERPAFDDRERVRPVVAGPTRRAQKPSMLCR